MLMAILSRSVGHWTGAQPEDGLDISCMGVWLSNSCRLAAVAPLYHRVQSNQMKAAYLISFVNAI
jgi:hypothetical protein